eukprot:symbB.v1.2.011497.t1/scaffold772.1/size165093/4
MRRVRSALLRYGWVEATSREELAEVLAYRTPQLPIWDKSSTGKLKKTEDWSCDFSRPFLLRNAIPREQRWSRDSFMDQFGDQNFKLRSCFDLHEYSYTGPWHENTLKEYFHDDSEDEIPTIIFENSFLPPSLHKALYNSRGGHPQELSHIHAEPILNLGKRNTFIAFHGGTCASWVSQLVGKTAWFLAPPGSRPEIAEPWTFVSSSQVTGIIAEEGDVIYIPDGWWRSIWNLEDFTLGLGWESADDGSKMTSDAMKAVASGDLEKLKDVKLEISQDILYLAARTGNEDVLAYLLQHEKPEPLNFGAISAGAAISGHWPALILLEPYSQRNGTWHPWALHGAVATNSAALKHLLATARETDAALEDEWVPDHFVQEGLPLTPLHLAAWNGHASAAQALLHAGASIDFLQEEKRRVPMWRPPMDSSVGSSPLHLASLRGHAEVIHVLLSSCSAPAKLVNAPDADEATALHRAAQGGHAHVLHQLLAAGADPALRAGPERWTSWEVAEALGFPEISTFLKQQPRPK